MHLLVSKILYFWPSGFKKKKMLCNFASFPYNDMSFALSCILYHSFPIFQKHCLPPQPQNHTHKVSHSSRLALTRTEETIMWYHRPMGLTQNTVHQIQRYAGIRRLNYETLFHENRYPLNYWLGSKYCFLSKAFSF